VAGLILFNKPFQVLSQFTDREGRATLADFLDAPGFRVAGRLDYDSEGLLLLTDDGRLQQQIANPGGKTWKTYLAQVEGEAAEQAVKQLRDGVKLRDGPTRPARVRILDAEPELWRREPPIRHRQDDITSWLEIKVTEGRNRQVRRMTAAVGLPTLRLVRVAVGNWELGNLAPGEFRRESLHMPLGRSRR
jgi:23S rRNA pseudouridine2457 synthase